MRPVFRDVEVADAEREVDRVDVFERRRQIRDVRERERQRQDRESRAHVHASPRDAGPASCDVRHRKSSRRLRSGALRSGCRGGIPGDRSVTWLIAERPQRAHEALGDRRVERARHFVAGDLEPRERVVMAARETRGSPASRSTVSACSIVRSFSSVTSLPYGMRDDRHADAGTSHVGRPATRDSARISSFDRSASSSGLRTPNSRAACRPGR